MNYSLPIFTAFGPFLVPLVFKKSHPKKTIKYQSDITGSGLHGSPFLANPAIAAGRSSKFLGRADNVEMLTTANLSGVSDLRTAAGDREHESNGFQLFPTRL